MRALPALVLLMTLGCRPDDVDDTGSLADTDGGATDGGATDGGAADGGSGDGGGDGGATTGACAGLDLVGSWLSEGDDISPLFQSVTFDYRSIQASFSADCAYTVLAETNDGDQYTLSGTWTADDSTAPATIVQTQAQPYVATAEGIWQVQGDVLSFEVVQTDPDYGFSPPTPDGGFGSTSGQGLSAGDNTQTYRAD